MLCDPHVKIKDVVITKVCCVGPDAQLLSRLEDLWVGMIQTLSGLLEGGNDERLTFEGAFRPRYAEAQSTGKLVLENPIKPNKTFIFNGKPI